MKYNIVFNKGKNKAGNFVFYTRAGVQIARGYSEMVSNPRTPNQIEARKKLAFISGIAKGFAPVLKMGYSVVDNAMYSARNFFVKDNYDNLTYNASTQVTSIAYEDLKLSKAGDINPVAPGEANFETPLTVTCVIDDGYEEPIYGLATDKVMLVVYNKTKGRCMYDNSKTRADSTLSCSVTGNWQGDFVETYVIVNRPADYGFECSEAIYCGTGRIS